MYRWRLSHAVIHLVIILKCMSMHAAFGHCISAGKPEASAELRPIAQVGLVPDTAPSTLHCSDKKTSQISGALPLLLRHCVFLRCAEGSSLQTGCAGAVFGAAAQHLSVVTSICGAS